MRRFGSVGQGLVSRRDRPGGPGADLRLRRGAGRHRAVRPPASRSTRPSRSSACRCAGARRTTGRSCASAAARNAWRACSPRNSSPRPGLPADPAGQQDAVAAWHRRKTEIYTEPGRRRRGPAPPRHRPDRRRGRWPRAGRWPSPRPRPSLGAGDAGTGGRAPNWPRGQRVRRRHRRRTRSPPRTSTCSRWTGSALPAGPAWWWSRTPATGCWPPPGPALACVITVNDFTADEDFSEAALVVSSLGDPGGERTRRCWPTAARPARATGSPWPTWPRAWARQRPEQRPTQGAAMPTASLGDVELVVRTIAQSRSTTRSTSATWTRSSATATSATRWRAASSWCCRTGTPSTAPTSAPS